MNVMNNNNEELRMKVSYKIFRKRQNKEYSVDITNRYSCTGSFDENEVELAFKYAEEYKKEHRSDIVTVVKITEEVIYSL